jgi:hypothetical protein
VRTCCLVRGRVTESLLHDLDALSAVRDAKFDVRNAASTPAFYCTTDLRVIAA